MSEETKKKHWRDVYNSEFLASWDLDKNNILTIRECKEQDCKLAKGKEVKVVAHFMEKMTSSGVKVKPMILNATNCKFIQIRTGIPFFKDWAGLKVEISVMANKGGIGNANGLNIINVILAIDISSILNSNDLDFVKTEANKVIKSLSKEQSEDIRNHITQLSNV